MRRILSRRPSGATAIAFVALFAALAGGAVALPGTNSVTSNDIRKNAVKGSEIARNAVKSSEIRRGAVKSSEVRNNSLTGNDINESTLGQVPSAATAGVAGRANSANTASFALSSGGLTPGSSAAREVIPYSFRLGDGASRTIATSGPLALSARCDIDDGGTDVGEIQLTTSVNNATMDANDGDEFQDFDIADNPASVSFHSTATDNDEIEQFNEGAVAAAPSGAALQMNNYGIGFNLFGTDNQCYFTGSVVTTGAT